MKSAEIEAFIDTVNLVAVLDHSGRAGNSFVLAIFDQHPEVLTCGWLHYAYSYLLAKYGDSDELDAVEAHTYWSTESYFRFLYQEADEAARKRLSRIGGDTDVELNRSVVREVFDGFVLSKQRISRKALLLSSYYAFAAGAGRDLSAVKYVLVDDAVSLRGENPDIGFSGKAIHAMVEDFSRPKLVSLVRDPRAAFASTRHQYVNEMGNMYGYRPRSFIEKLASLVSCKLTSEDCACLYIWFYHSEAARTVYRLKDQYPELFYTLKNENLNLNFLPTIEKFCDWLGVSRFPAWSEQPYVPTMMGAPWKGTGAYNKSYYKQESYGPLKNDPPEVAAKVTGPNEYVTKRWRSRLSSSEIKLCEVIFKDELEDLDYPFLFDNRPSASTLKFLGSAFAPFKGELPKLSWLIAG
ncbi:MAG: hypothetical protein KDD66_05365, partial [Bdellovibrionales bacterium]|nr:hypothetical protein [Bdellovibrionales bacterium]